MDILWRWLMRRWENSLIVNRWILWILLKKVVDIIWIIWEWFMDRWQGVSILWRKWMKFFVRRNRTNWSLPWRFVLECTFFTIRFSRRRKRYHHRTGQILFDFLYPLFASRGFVIRREIVREYSKDVETAPMVFFLFVLERSNYKIPMTLFHMHPSMLFRIQILPRF